MKRSLLFLSMTVMCLPALIRAQDATTTPTEPAPRTKVSIGAVIDGYYCYNFTNAAVSQLGKGNLNYVNNADSVDTLALAELSLGISQGEAGIHLTTVLGSDVDALLNKNIVSLVGPVFNQYWVWEAYGTYHPGDWTFRYGRFADFLGNEVLESNKDWNYSRSLMFYDLPFSLTGLDTQYASPDGLWDVTGYLYGDLHNNGLPSFPPESARSYGLKADYRPRPNLTLTLKGLTGPIGDNLSIFARYYMEVLIHWDVDPKFSIVVDGLLNDSFHASSGFLAPWETNWGATLYGRYQIAPDWDVALRLEETQDLIPSYTDPTLITYAAYNFEVREVTLTVGHHFSDHVLVRIEGRYDYQLSNGQTYAPGAGPYAGRSDDQYTGTAGVVISF